MSNNTEAQQEMIQPAASTLRQVASLIDAGEVTAVLVLAVVGGDVLYQRAFIDGFAGAELVLKTMDMVDTLRADVRGTDRPLPPAFVKAVPP